MATKKPKLFWIMKVKFIEHILSPIAESPTPPNSQSRMKLAMMPSLNTVMILEKSLLRQCIFII